MARVVAFLNFKGGVGKTSNVVNIAGGLAATHKKRVLIVDLDPQCNASLWLLKPLALRAHMESGVRTVAQVFRDRLLGTRRFHLEEAVAHGVPRSDKGFYLIDRLDLLPASLSLLEIEEQLVQRRSISSFRILHEQLTPHLGGYDYVLIDCAPNFFSLTKNAIFFAEQIVVPYLPDYLSLAGFHTLSRLVEEFGRRVSGVTTRLGKTRISMVIVNRYRTVGNVFQQGLLELEKLLGDLKTQQLIHPQAMVLKPEIRDCVRVAEAPAVHLPIVLHDQRQQSNGAIDYAALTQSFMRHIEEIS